MRPFRIEIPEEQIDDLKRRLQYSRLPGGIFQVDSQDGISLPFMRRLMDYWREGFDWRAQEADIQGYSVHFLHKAGVGPAPVPLVLTHGWPGSFLEFETLIQHLTDPASHGGDPRDAFDVVVPSLPGFGFSPAPEGPGTNSRRIAELWHDLMRILGYERYFAQGGDIGAGVSTWLGVLSRRNVVGEHLPPLVRQQHRRVFASIQGEPEITPRTGRTNSVRRTLRDRALSKGTAHSSPILDRTRTQGGTVDGNASGRAFCRLGATAGTRRRYKRLVPALAQCKTNRQRL